MVKDPLEGPQVGYHVSHKISVQGWHCSKCGKSGGFRLDTRETQTLYAFMTKLDVSHRGTDQHCKATPGFVRGGEDRPQFAVDSDGRRWCGDFVIGNAEGPWLRVVSG